VASYYKGDFMLKRIFKILFILLLSIVFVGSMAIAKDRGNVQSSDRPAGWDKGKKEGWQSDVPPGLEEKEKKKKKNPSDEEEIGETQKEKKEKKEKGATKKKKSKQSKKK
jgi:hypothetical protein